MILPGEQRFQYETALRQLQAFPGSWILEIGSFRGGSAHCFAQAILDTPDTPDSPESMLVCIDPFFGCYDEGLRAVLQRDFQGASSFVPFCEALGPARLARTIPVAATADKAAILLGHLHAPPFGLALIDGDHTWQAQLRDLELARSLLLPGATILCHDSSWEDTQIATAQFSKQWGYQLERGVGGDFDRITV